MKMKALPYAASLAPRTSCQRRSISATNALSVVDRAAANSGPHALQLLRLEGGLIQRLVLLLLLRWRLGRIEPLHLASASDDVVPFER
eukprot:3813616-Prymnesium_polylepis.1